MSQIKLIEYQVRSEMAHLKDRVYDLDIKQAILRGHRENMGQSTRSKTPFGAKKPYCDASLSFTKSSIVLIRKS